MALSGSRRSVVTPHCIKTTARTVTSWTIQFSDDSVFGRWFSDDGFRTMVFGRWFSDDQFSDGGFRVPVLLDCHWTVISTKTKCCLFALVDSKQRQSLNLSQSEELNAQATTLLWGKGNETAGDGMFF
jgi:hypothetical protein